MLKKIAEREYIDLEHPLNKEALSKIPEAILKQWASAQKITSSKASLRFFKATICNKENCPVDYGACRKERQPLWACWYYDIMLAYIKGGARDDNRN
jgi:hypothetical protein